MDYKDHIETLLENMYGMLESHEVMEGFFSRRKEKKAAKYLQNKLKGSIIISKNELSKCEKEFNNVVNFMRGLLKKEVPGCVFIDKDIKHTVRDIGGGHKEHEFKIKLFQMDDENYDKYKSKSKCKELRDAENSWDYVDELLADNENRIKKPIQAKGFTGIEDDTRFVNKKDGKDYISISLGDEATFDIDVFMYVVVKEEE